MKIMLLVLHKINDDTLKKIRSSISRRNFSILINSKKVDKLMLNKYSFSNLADLFIKPFPTSTFEKLVYGIGMW